MKYSSNFSFLLFKHKIGSKISMFTNYFANNEMRIDRSAYVLLIVKICPHQNKLDNTPELNFRLLLRF